MMSLPEIAQLEFDTAADAVTTTVAAIHKTLDWDFETGDFKLTDGKLVELTGLDYLKVWIQKALRTDKGSLIYDGTDYGSEHHTLIGRNFHPAFSNAEYERTISECLLGNTAITAVGNFVFEQSGSRLNIGFVVSSIYGSTEQEVMI